jgi:small subunit ribosomal protein S16
LGPTEVLNMVTIRLTRRGGTNQPFYHVVVTDSRVRQNGSNLEMLGYFNPVARGKDVRLKLDLARVDHWLKVGAQQSDRVRQLVTSYRKEAAQQAVAA